MENDYASYFEARNWGQANSEANFWYYDGLRKIVPLLAGASVLEIGFGDGRFLDWCVSRKLKPVGVEILQAALDKAHSLGHKVYLGPFSPATLPGDHIVDLIAIFDVIEHLTINEIRQLLKDLLPHLAPNGRIVLRFPNGNSPFVGPVQTSDITHRTLVSPGTMLDICTPLNLQIQHAFNDRMLPPGLGPKLRRRLAYALRSVIEAVISRAYFGAAMPLDPNVFVVLGRRS